MGGNRQPASVPDIVRQGNVVFGMDDLVTRWVAKRIPHFHTSQGARAIGITKGNDLVAGVVYERWNGVHVEASIAADPATGWASRSAMFALFYYPFVTLDCQAISVLVPSSNLASLNLATKMGFHGEAIVRFAAHDGSDLIVLKQFREQCRWLRYGQGKQGTNAA